MRTFASNSHRLHFPAGELSGGQFVRPFECPERWQHIVNALDVQGFDAPVEPAQVPASLLAKVHDGKYLHFLENAWQWWCEAGYSEPALPSVVPARRMQQREPAHIDGKLGYYAMAIETAIIQGTWQAAISSASCAYSAAAYVQTGHCSSFALCRPPGHHAAIDLYGGYCFINNAAVAAQLLLDKGASRVALLDVDFHHGNGTQDIFYERDDVLFVSLHGDPIDAFPHFLGYADERGEGIGDGFNRNYALPEGCNYEQWSTALKDGMKHIERYAPDALVVSLGVDTFEKDPISFFKLKSEDFLHYGALLATLKLPTVFVMEGGYAVTEIGTNTVNVLQGFENG
ncbi:MAG: histone deacetylase family protein [Granulosicoccus sp.]